MSFPAEQYPATFSKDGLLGRFVILFPMLFVVVAIGVSMILAVVYLPDDRKQPKSKGEHAPLIVPTTKNTVYESTNRCNENNNDIDNEDDDVNVEYDRECFWKVSLTISTATNEDTKWEGNCEYYHLLEPIPDISMSTKPTTKLFSMDRLKDGKLFQVVRSKECMLTSLVYGLFSFASVGSSEMFPLFTATAKDYHGFGFSVSGRSSYCVFL